MEKYQLYILLFVGVLCSALSLSTMYPPIHPAPHSKPKVAAAEKVEANTVATGKYVKLPEFKNVESVQPSTESDDLTKRINELSRPTTAYNAAQLDSTAVFSPVIVKSSAIDYSPTANHYTPGSAAATSKSVPSDLDTGTPLYNQQIKTDAYGYGVNSNQYGQPVKYAPAYDGSFSPGEQLTVKPDAYGMGMGMDQYGRPVKTVPAY